MTKLLQVRRTCKNLKKIPANSYIGEGHVEEQISNDGDADLFYKDFGKHT